jgi:hypothetical protein
MEVNWVSKAIGHMTRKKEPERWETKLANTEVTPQAVWPIAKFVANKDGPRASTVIHGPSGPKFQPVDEAIAIADCLEKQFTLSSTRSCSKRSPEKVRPRVLQKLINY